jgi:hypothetical protein
MTFRYEVEGEVWAYAGKSGWHFLTLPKDLTSGLRTLRGTSHAWGSMRVQATLGGATWNTSIFPDTKSGAFLLPIKAEVRAREGILAGDRVSVSIEVAI